MAIEIGIEMAIEIETGEMAIMAVGIAGGSVTTGINSGSVETGAIKGVETGAGDGSVETGTGNVGERENGKNCP